MGYKVLIVDDEILARLGIKSMLSWESLGVTQVLEAANGEYGLECILNEQPDIVITDIKMPVKSGVDMMREAVAHKSKSKFVVLSGYDDFAYVKEAMRMGACEYFIKIELSAQSLEKTLREIISEIQKNYDDSQYQASNLYTDEARKNFLRELVDDPVWQENKASLFLFGKNYFKREHNFMCGAIRIENSNAEDAPFKNDPSLLNVFIENLVQDILLEQYAAAVFRYDSKMFLFVVQFPSNADETNLFLSVCHRIVLLVKKYAQISAHIGVADASCPVKALHKNLNHAVQAGLRAAFLGKDVLGYREVSYMKQAYSSEEIIHRLQTAIRECSPKDLEKWGEELNRLYAGLPQADIRKLCIQIASKLRELIVEENERLLISPIFFDEQILLSALPDTAAVCLEWVETLVQDIKNVMQQRADDSVQKAVRTASEYITCNYTQNLSLCVIAAQVYLSPNYLSHIFKQQTGMTITDFICSCKIEKAKEMLLQSKKIYEISECLNYKTAHYFTRSFKKVTGMTPTEYLQAKRGEGAGLATQPFTVEK